MSTCNPVRTCKHCDLNRLCPKISPITERDSFTLLYYIISYSRIWFSSIAKKEPVKEFRSGTTYFSRDRESLANGARGFEAHLPKVDNNSRGLRLRFLSSPLKLLGHGPWGIKFIVVGLSNFGCLKIPPTKHFSIESRAHTPRGGREPCTVGWALDSAAESTSTHVSTNIRARPPSKLVAQANPNNVIMCRVKDKGPGHPSEIISVWGRAILLRPLGLAHGIHSHVIILVLIPFPSSCLPCFWWGKSIESSGGPFHCFLPSMFLVMQIESSGCTFRFVLPSQSSELLELLLYVVFLFCVCVWEKTFDAIGSYLVRHMLVE